VIALVLASQAKQEIAYSGGRVGGEGLVTASRVIAWINIGLCVAGLALFALLVAVSTSSVSTATF
jgi:hypothetical protein